MFRYYLRVEGHEPIDITSLGTFTVGRCGDLQITNDLSVSRKHFLISLPKGGKHKQPWIFDGDGSTPSRNGTIINGNKCLRADAETEDDKGCPIYHGDFIQAGKLKIYFSVVQSTAFCDPNQTLGEGNG